MSRNRWTARGTMPAPVPHRTHVNDADEQISAVVVDEFERIVGVTPAALERFGRDSDSLLNVDLDRALGWLGYPAFTSVALATGGAVVTFAPPEGLSSAAEEHALRRFILFCPCPIAVHQNGRVTLVNQALAELLGYDSGGPLVGAYLFDLLTDEEAYPNAPTDRHLRRRDGTTVPTEMVTHDAILDDMMVDVTFVRDLSAVRQVEHQLHQMSQMITMGTIASGVAHEVNNPLTYVGANISYARQALEQASCLDTIDESVDMLPNESVSGLLRAMEETEQGVAHIRAIVDDLRSLAHPSAGDELGAIELGPVLETALRMAKANQTESYTLVRDYGATSAVNGNAARLGQVFLNLLVNAVQAMQAVHAAEPARMLVTVNSRRIRVRTADRGGGVLVTIADDGCGMPAHVIERAFDAFFTTKSAGEGTGLGLAISRRLVESCGGHLDIESELGVGTICRVWLPRSREPVSEPARLRLPDVPHSGRILVIDRDPLLGAALARMLGAEHEVEVTATVSEALARLAAQEPFDVVICDLVLRARAGIAILAALEASGHRARLLFMHAGTPGESLRAFLHEVDVPCIDKPFDKAQVDQVLSEYLGARHPSDQRTG